MLVSLRPNRSYECLLHIALLRPKVCNELSPPLGLTCFLRVLGFLPMREMLDTLLLFGGLLLGGSAAGG